MHAPERVVGVLGAGAGAVGQPHVAQDEVGVLQVRELLEGDRLLLRDFLAKLRGHVPAHTDLLEEVAYAVAEAGLVESGDHEVTLAVGGLEEAILLKLCDGHPALLQRSGADRVFAVEQEQ